MVIWLGAWRVNGSLSVSRAIGDARDKKFITADADTVSMEHYIICASLVGKLLPTVCSPTKVETLPTRESPFMD